MFGRGGMLHYIKKLEALSEKVIKLENRVKLLNPDPELKDIEISKLTDNFRIINTLSHAGIEYVSQLNACGSCFLLKQKGLGRKTYNEIKKICFEVTGSDGYIDFGANISWLERESSLE